MSWCTLERPSDQACFHCRSLLFLSIQRVNLESAAFHHNQQLLFRIHFTGYSVSILQVLAFILVSSGTYGSRISTGVRDRLPVFYLSFPLISYNLVKTFKLRYLIKIPKNHHTEIHVIT